VGKHADEHLRRFLAARDRGDAPGMRRWWDALVIDFYDRIDGFVGAAHKGRLDDDEHELAVAMSLARFSDRLLHTFAGVSMGELVNATKTLARGICIDVQRSSVRERRRTTRPLDEDGWELGESVRRYDDEQRAAEVRDFLDWAMPQVGPDRRRVLELTFEGAELPEIMRELGISRDNAYQRRSRGLKDLAKLKERYDA
jgi:RNA polymerase sigma factor (sigma-70 family)